MAKRTKFMNLTLNVSPMLCSVLADTDADQKAVSPCYTEGDGLFMKKGEVELY
jgi:hypothetical protein